MSVIAIGSVRSCGATTLAAGLAMLWPQGGSSRLLVEADPAGGTLAADAGLAVEPGLVSLAAAARRGGSPDLVFQHCQHLADGTAVLCGPPGADRARSALTMAAGVVGRLGDLDVVVFVDCGRLDPGGPSSELFNRADIGVLVVRPRLADLHALAALLEGQDSAHATRVLVLVGSGPYPAGEVTQALAVPVAGQVPWDPDSADALASTTPTSRRLTRAPLVRSIRTLADDLAGRVRPNAASLPTDPEATASHVMEGSK